MKIRTINFKRNFYIFNLCFFNSQQILHTYVFFYSYRQNSHRYALATEPWKPLTKGRALWTLPQRHESAARKNSLSSRIELTIYVSLPSSPGRKLMGKAWIEAGSLNTPGVSLTIPLLVHWHIWLYVKRIVIMKSIK